MNQTAINNIGDVLLEIGKVTRADLDRATEVQRQTGQKLGRMLIDLGTVSEEDLRLAYSKLLQVPIWEKKKDDRYPLVENMPKVFLMANRVLPLSLHDGTLDIALADPQDSLLVETIALARINKYGFLPVVKRIFWPLSRPFMKVRLKKRMQ